MVDASTYHRVMTSRAVAATVLPPASKTVLSIVAQLEVPTGLFGLVEAAEHRLLSGIAIGMLPVGQKLPSEEVMARTFSMAPLTFRRSLDRLRAGGLIVTRAGRGGGTTVTAIPAVGDFGGAVNSSIVEASDLALGLGAILGQCARTAALRADAADGELLTHHLELVRAAATASQKRSAEMMLMIGFASVARSERLKDVAIPMIGKLQLLRWRTELTAQDDGGTSRELTSMLSEVVRAVRDHDVASAQQMAEETVMSVCDAIRKRGRGGDADRGNSGGVDDTRTHAEVLDRFDRLASTMRNLRDQLVRVASVVGETTTVNGTRFRPADEPGEALRSIIDDEPNLVRGAGVAYDPSVLGDPPLWLDWWDVDEGNEVMFKPHAFSSHSVQFYDYRLMPWFRDTADSERFGAFGPYIDQGGVEQLTITVAVPVLAGPIRGSVVGADVRPRSIEQLMYGGAGPEPSSAIVAKGGRVVTSNMPGILLGDRLDLDLWRPVATDEITGWQLILEE